MKALYFFNHGAIDNVVFGDVDEPVAKPDEAVIRVRACAINHLDLWVLRGWPGLRLTFPHIGGADIAGEIHALGDKVTGLKEGAKVIVTPGFASVEDEFTKSGQESLSPSYQIFGENRPGGFAQFVAVPAKCIHPMPDGLTFSEACAPLLVGMTCWRMLRERAQLKSGETVLVVGSGGGVNSFAIQLAKSFGAEVIVLAGTDDKGARAYQLGAKHVINYRKLPDWSREVRRITNSRGVDVVVDNVGAQTFAQSMNSVRRGGRIVTVGNTSGPNVSFDNRLMFSKQISLLGSTMGSAKDFAEMIEYTAEHKIKAPIDRMLELKDGKNAYRILEQGEHFGKVVICP